MAASAASALPQPRLTLIVAATQTEMGIGLHGSLPWPLLRNEMAYFTRVTRRAAPRAINAVVMGRRTWDSIPSHFRPLKGRINIVVTRRPGDFDSDVPLSSSEDVGPYAVTSFSDALELLGRRQILDHDNLCARLACGQTENYLSLGRAFVIGGAEVYHNALKSDAAERILLTRVMTRFACDTYFPMRLDGSTASFCLKGKPTRTWLQRSLTDLSAWVGEEVPSGIRQEQGVEWAFEMWEADTKQHD